MDILIPIIILTVLAFIFNFVSHRTLNLDNSDIYDDERAISLEQFQNTILNRNKDIGFIDSCEVAENDDKMRKLHRNMWRRESTQIDEVADFQSIVIGGEIENDTDRLQRKLMRAAKNLSLDIKK